MEVPRRPGAFLEFKEPAARVRAVAANYLRLCGIHAPACVHIRMRDENRARENGELTGHWWSRRGGGVGVGARLMFGGTQVASHVGFLLGWAVVLWPYSLLSLFVSCEA